MFVDIHILIDIPSHPLPCGTRPTSDQDRCGVGARDASGIFLGFQGSTIAVWEKNWVDWVSCQLFSELFAGVILFDCHKTHFRLVGLKPITSCHFSRPSGNNPTCV